MSDSLSVRIVEVGPRDGLQNEPAVVPVNVRLEFLDRLARAGLRSIEAAAFVSPKWIPQMASSAELLERMQRAPGVTYSALVPNLQGLEVALGAGVDEVAIFTAASETFAQKNINCSIQDSIKRFEPVMMRAHQAQVRVRGYISCVLGCPYEGAISPIAVRDLAARLFEMGCYEVSLGDTIGVGTPATTKALMEAVSEVAPVSQLAGHFHDTYGQALVNVYASLQYGVRVFDASVSGLGGCPYAPGASGNLATEDLVYMLQGMGVDTGIQLRELLEAGAYICEQLHRVSRSKVAQALAVDRDLKNVSMSSG